jgi:hypothetical protein
MGINTLQSKTISVLLCCLPLAVIVISSIQQEYNILSFTLDDPYIHLELAKNLFNGNYGINPHEFSSPSSSIIWPFVLAPFSVFDWYIYTPLILNTVFLGLTITFILIQLVDYVEPYFLRILTVISIAFSLNLYGLVMTGMEHSLQVLCSCVIAYGFADKDFRRSNTLLFYFALVIAPLVRYESLALTVPVMLYLISFKEDRKLALLSGVILVVTIGIFSLFLYINSGYFFPSSVMIKQSAVSEAETMNFLTKLIANTYSQLSKYGWLVAIFAGVLILARVDKKFLFACASATFLYLTLGKHGWFGRYEVFFVMFASVLLLTIARQKLKPAKFTVAIVVLLMPLAFLSLVSSTLLTPLASSNIYNQQYLVSQFVKGLNEPIAVNDLGLISLNSERTVVDLVGLGNLDAMTARKNNEASYVDRLMSKNDARFAIIYREWFSEKQLENLIFVGSLTLNETRITPASDTVSFFANTTVSAEELKIKLREFDFKNNTLFLDDAFE